MQAVTKMGDLTKFRQSDDFYAINITRDGPNMLANLTILAIFMQIIAWSRYPSLTNFSQ